MDSVLKYGLMERSTQENGDMARLKVKELSFMRMEMSLMATLRQTKLMVQVYISTRMVNVIMVNGQMMFSKV